MNAVKIAPRSGGQPEELQKVSVFRRDGAGLMIEKFPAGRTPG